MKNENRILDLFSEDDQAAPEGRKAGGNGRDVLCADGASLAATKGVFLSPAQADASRHEPGVSVCFATAGAGKTTTVSARIAALALSLGELGERTIFASSFTKEASRHLGLKIDFFLGRKSRVEVGTFHGLCFRLLKDHWRKLGFSSRPQIMSTRAADMRLKAIVLEKTGKTKLKEIEEFSLDAVEEWMYALDVQGFSSDSVAASADLSGVKLPTDPRILAIVQAVHAEYHSANFNDNIMDFSEIMTRTLELLRNARLNGLRLSGMPEHVFIDEAQDLDAIQWMLVEELSSSAKSLVLIGDDDQAIYGWRGALPQKFIAFLRQADHVHILPENRRCAQNIVWLASEVVGKIPQMRRVEKNLSASREAEGDITLAVALEYAGIMEKLALKIKADHESGKVPYSENAFLFRNGRGSSAFRQIQGVLVKNGVPMVIRGGGSVFDEEEVRFLKAFLNIVTLDSGMVFTFWEEAAVILGISENAANKICETAKAKGGDLNALENALRTSRIHEKNKAVLGKFIEIVKKVKKESSGAAEIKLGFLLEHYPVKSLIEIIASDAGRKTAASRRERGGVSEKEEQALAEELARSRTASFMDAVKPFLETPLTEISERFSLDENPASKNDSEKVVVSTAHSAKGLEWKNVYIFDAKDGVWPSRRAQNKGYTDDKMLAMADEEKRLLYVAITRAKDSLLLISDADTGFGYKKEPSSPIPYLPSGVLRSYDQIQRNARQNGKKMDAVKIVRPKAK